MEMYKELDKLEELLGKEIEKITAKNDLTPVDLKAATDAVCLMMKVKKLKDGDYEEDYEYSERRGRSPYTGRYVSRGPMSYSHGMSGHSVEDRTRDVLERMMDSETSEYGREFLSEMIRKIR